MNRRLEQWNSTCFPTDTVSEKQISKTTEKIQKSPDLTTGNYTPRGANHQMREENRNPLKQKDRRHKLDTNLRASPVVSPTVSRLVGSLTIVLDYFLSHDSVRSRVRSPSTLYN